MDLREPVLAALLRGLDRDCLPFRPFLCGALIIELHNCSGRNERYYFSRADLDRFLHDQVHVFSFRDCLREADPAAERRRARLVQFAKLYLPAVDFGDFRRDFAPATVEEHCFAARLQTENIARVMRFTAA